MEDLVGNDIVDNNDDDGAGKGDDGRWMADGWCYVYLACFCLYCSSLYWNATLRSSLFLHYHCSVPLSAIKCVLFAMIR